MDVNPHNKVLKAIKEFEDKQDELADFGAADTEPRCELWGRVRYLVQHGSLIKQTEEQRLNSWELYTCKTGWEGAARKLETAWNKLEKVIVSSSFGDVQEALKYYGELPF